MCCFVFLFFWFTELLQVTVTLLGAEGNSEPHHLADSRKGVFERGAVDLFLLAAPFSLGELQGIRLWHNNAGSRPAWFGKRRKRRRSQRGRFPSHWFDCFFFFFPPPGLSAMSWCRTCRRSRNGISCATPGWPSTSTTVCWIKCFQSPPRWIWRASGEAKKPRCRHLKWI